MPYAAAAIANYFIDLSLRDGRPCTPMKLQKLVFFAHGWHLAITDSPLIDEQVEAWKFGPVIRSLYRAFRDSGNQPVTSNYRPLETEFDGADLKWHYGAPPSVDDDPANAEFTKKLLNKVWDVFGKYTAFQLSNMTHEPGTPWARVVQEYGGDPPKHTDIPPYMIRDYFAELGKRPKNAGATGHGTT